MTDLAPGSRLRRLLVFITRYGGALALLAVGLDHLEQYSGESYSVIPTIGTLFLLNFVSASVLTIGLFAPVQRLPGRAGRLAVPFLALSGVGVAAGALAGLLISEAYGLFGFMETGYRSAIVVAIVLDVVTIVLLGAYLVLRPRAETAVPCALRSHLRRAP
jgi:hypothetical protein